MTWLFISGTINGTFLSIRQYEELSITTVPFLAKRGAISLDIDAPAENIANSGLASIASITLTTFTGFPLKIISLPTDFSDAAGNNCETGKFLSSSTFVIVLPTIPVAPTTAIFILFFGIK